MTARRSVIHPSFYPPSVLVTVREKNIPKLFQNRKFFWSFCPKFGGHLQDPCYFWPEFWGENKKPRLLIILSPMVFGRRHSLGR